MIEQVGSTARLGWAAAVRLTPFGREPIRFRQAFAQAVEGGNRSLGLVLALCFFVGVIVALQSAAQLQSFGTLDLVPNLVAVSVTREFAPLLSAVIVAGRYASAIAAELGTMRVTQEIDALEVIGVDPIAYLVVPRLLALGLMLPCLVTFGDLMGIFGGWLVATVALDQGSTRYVVATIEALELQDIYAGLAKSFGSALAMGLVACQQGLSTRGGAQMVGQATTTTVVRSIVLIVIIDLIFTSLFFAG